MANKYTIFLDSVCLYSVLVFDVIYFCLTNINFFVPHVTHLPDIIGLIFLDVIFLIFLLSVLYLHLIQYIFTIYIEKLFYYCLFPEVPKRTNRDRHRPKQTETDRNRPKQTETDRNRPKQTETDRNRD